MLILQQMIILFLMMITGYICFKRKMISSEVCKSISGIVVNIANPALLLSSSMQEEAITGKDLATAAMVVVVMYASLLLIAGGIPYILKVRKEERGVFRAMTVFSNIGFMGFPIISSLYGSGALLYATLFMIPYNILIYIYGVISMKSSDASHEKISWRSILNIGTIACVLALFIYLMKIPVPGVVKVTLGYFGNLAAPLSMIVIGCLLAQMDIKKLFMDVRLLIFSAMKLLLIPAIGVLIARNMITNHILLGVCMVMLATPVGSMTAMLAQEYDGDYELASRGVALTTLFSVFTIPLISMLV